MTRFSEGPRGQRFIRRRPRGLNQLTLRIFAMAMTVLAEMGALIPGWQPAFVFRRMAFPLFAFFINEGFTESRNKTLYGRRLLVFALISEPFYDLLNYETFFRPEKQNVLFTLFISYMAVCALDFVRRRYENSFITFVTAGALWAVSFVVGHTCCFDMEKYDVAFALMFNITEHLVYTKPAQLAAFIYTSVKTNGSLKAGGDRAKYMFYSVLPIAVPLILIWAHNGERGPDSLKVKHLFYAFYPTQLFILALLRILSI